MFETGVCYIPPILNVLMTGLIDIMGRLPVVQLLFRIAEFQSQYFKTHSEQIIYFESIRRNVCWFVKKVCFVFLSDKRHDLQIYPNNFNMTSSFMVNVIYLSGFRASIFNYCRIQ